MHVGPGLGARLLDLHSSEGKARFVTDASGDEPTDGMGDELLQLLNFLATSSRSTRGKALFDEETA